MNEEENFAEKILQEIEREMNQPITVKIEKGSVFYEWISKITPTHSRWRLLLFLPNFVELVKITTQIEKEKNGEI